LQVREGDVLSFDYLKNGARSYLAVAGGVDVPVFMHSRSTYTLIGLGGHEGRALKEGDELSLGEARNGEAQVGKRVETTTSPATPKRPSFGSSSASPATGSRKRA
jgi:allophanate hydrolase subunit 2